jgi:hypothetical protein
LVANTVVDRGDGFRLVRAEELKPEDEQATVRKRAERAYDLASASGAGLGMLHGMTTVAVATVDLAKLSSLNGELGGSTTEWARGPLTIW